MYEGQRWTILQMCCDEIDCAVFILGEEWRQRGRFIGCPCHINSGNVKRIPAGELEFIS